MSMKYKSLSLMLVKKQDAQSFNGFQNWKDFNVAATQL